MYKINAKHGELPKWIQGLSPDILEKLKTTLSIAVPVIEIWEMREYDLIPLSAFLFQQKGISGGSAILLLEEVGNKTGSEIKEVHYNDGSHLRITVGETAKILRYAQQLIVKEVGIDRKGAKYILTLDKNGDLWRTPKEKFCYPMMESKVRLKIVRFLATSQVGEYIDTKGLARALEKDTQYIRSEIGKINNIAKKELKLQQQKFIDGKQGSGYRINPNIKILTR